MKRAYFMVGAPATGKSTFIAKNLTTEFEDCRIISSDAYVEKFAADLGKTYSAAFEEVIPYASLAVKEDFEDAIAKGESYVIDMTNMWQKPRAKWMPPTHAGYTKIAFVFPTPNTQLSRASSTSRISAR